MEKPNIKNVISGFAGAIKEEVKTEVENDFKHVKVELLGAEVVTLKGEQGQPGIQGEKGEQGEPGKDGRTPVKGVDYFDGKDGKDGIDGRDGKDGKDGVKGDPGKDGKDGKDASPKDVVALIKKEKSLDISHLRNSEQLTSAIGKLKSFDTDGFRFNGKKYKFSELMHGAGSGGGSSIELQTNGTPNGDQSLLNLVQGTNVTITDDGMGGVTIAATGGIGVQSVTGLNTDNTDPANPVVQISVDGTTITGLGTPADPLLVPDIFVPYTGASGNVDLGMFNLTANQITTGSLAIDLITPNLTDNIILQANSGGTVDIRDGSSGFSAIFDTTALAADKTFTFPNDSGTIALTSNLPTPSALTKTDDTNVTLTLGGSPSVSLLAATSLTLGWSGQLALSRGGTGANLSDPGANTLLGWDDTDNAVSFFTIGSGLSYDHSTHTLSASGGISIGDSIGSATEGSVLFVGASGVLAQDNANLFWDDTNNRLGIGTALPAGKLQIADETPSALLLGNSNVSSIGDTADAGFPGMKIAPYNGVVHFGISSTNNTALKIWHGGSSFLILQETVDGGIVKTNNSTHPLLLQDNGGLVGIGNTSPGALLDIGTAGSTLGTLRLEGNTSGYVQIQTAAAAGSWTLTLPVTDGSANQVLQTDGSGITTWTDVPIKTDTKTQTAQVADITSTNLTTTGAGLYRLAYYLLDSVADLTAGAVSLSITYTDNGAAQTVQSSPIALTTLGTFTQGEFIIQLASGNIAYSTSHTGIFGTSKYDLFLTLERLN